MGPLVFGGVNPILLMGGMEAVSQAADAVAGVEDAMNPESFMYALALGGVMKYGIPQGAAMKTVLKGGGVAARLGRQAGLVGIKAGEATLLDPTWKGVQALATGNWDEFDRSVKEMPGRFAEIALTFAFMNSVNAMKAGGAGAAESELIRNGIGQTEARKLANSLIYSPEAGKVNIFRRLKLAYSKMGGKELAEVFKERMRRMGEQAWSRGDRGERKTEEGRRKTERIEDWAAEHGAKERVFERFLDSRAASTERVEKDRPRTLLTDFDDIGLTFRLTPGDDIDDGVKMVDDALDYDPEKPLDFFNKPKFYVCEDCRNTIYALETWTGADGQKGACKDWIDLIRYFFLLDLGYVGVGFWKTVGGGFW
jgi:hypothetical protein